MILFHPNHPCTYGGKEGPLCKVTRGYKKKCWMHLWNFASTFCHHLKPLPPMGLSHNHWHYDGMLCATQMIIKDGSGSFLEPLFEPKPMLIVWRGLSFENHCIGSIEVEYVHTYYSFHVDLIEHLWATKRNLVFNVLVLMYHYIFSLPCLCFSQLFSMLSKDYCFLSWVGECKDSIC